MEAFISYSRKNKAFVQTLAMAFEKVNRQIWVDWESIPLNAEWWKEIETGIESANAFIFIITPDSIRSEICTRELEHALKHHKRLIPILHQEVKSGVPSELAALNWNFFRDNDDFNEAFTALLANLDTDLERVRMHTRLISRAVEWDKHQHDTSFLLRGNDLINAQQWLSRSIEKPPEPTQLQTQYIIQSVRLASKNQRLKLIAVAIGLVIAIALGLFAVSQWDKAETERNRATINHIYALTSLSEAQLATHDELGALMAGVKAAKQWQNFSELANESSDKKEIGHLKNNVYNVLKEAISETQERNRLELHKDRVQTVRFNPNLENPQYLVSSSSDNTALVWNRDGKLHIKEALKHEGSVYGISISSDGKFFATASADKSVKLWNFKGNLLHTLKYSVEIHDVSISPDGKKIAAASEDKHVLLWENNNEQWQLRKDVQMEHASSLQTVSFSHNGKLLASGSSDRTAKIWNVADFQHKATLVGHQDRLYAICFTPHDKTLATASADNTIRLWNIEEQNVSSTKTPLILQEALKIPAHTNWVFDLQYSPDGKTLASASANGTVKLWNSDGTLLKIFRNPGIRMTSVSFSSDGEWLASAGGDNMIRLYKLDASSAVKIIEGHTSGLKDVDVSPPDGQTIASTGSDGTVRIWDSQTYRLLHTLKTKASVRDVDYMDSNWLVAATYENTVQFWQIKQQAAQKMTSRLVHTISKTAGKVKSVAFNAQKNQLAITQSNHIQLWALKFEDSQIKVEPLLEKLLKGHRKPVNAISFSPNGKFLASGSADHTAILWYWDTKTSKVLTGHDSWINNVGFSQDSKYLATASSDHTIKLWRVADGQLLTTTQKQDRHKDWVWDVSFAPNKSLNKNHYILVSGGADNVIKLWHYYPEKQIKLVRSLRGHEGWVRSVGFSNDGDYIVSASADQTIRFWELKHFGQQNIESNVKKLLKTGCNLLSNYLANNAKLKESDKEICQ